MHRDEWAGKVLPVEELLQISSLSETELDSHIQAHLKQGQRSKSG
jgi:hypothetical protein